MQVLSYLTMPKPKTFTANDILTAKDQVFAALKPYDLQLLKKILCVRNMQAPK